MKKYLLPLFTFCIAMISQDILAQSITIFAWEDMNGDGLQADEVGIPGIPMGDLQIFLDANSNGSLDGGEVALNYDMETTAGEYLFDNAGAGLAAGQYVATYNLGNLDNYFITTPAAGGPAEDSDFDQATGTTIVIDLTGGGDEVDIDLGLYLAAEISNFVWEDINGDGSQAGEGGNGLAGITVNLLDEFGAAVTVDVTGPVPPITTTTGGAGDYAFMNLIPGNYIVEFVLPTIGVLDWFATEYTAHTYLTDNGDNSDAIPNIPNNPQTHVIELSSGEVNDMIDAGFYAGSTVGDFVFCDENGNGIDDGEPGVERMDVQLIDVATGAIAIDAEGNAFPVINILGGMYMFENVKPGDYYVEFLFNATVPIGQFAFTEKNAPGSTNTTDSDVESDGASPNFGRTDEFEVVSRDIEEEEQWDAGVYQLITIEGTVWLEDDANSINDPGENGPGGIVVEIFDATTGNKFGEGTTSAGVYTIDDIPPGEYFLQINTVGTSLEGATGCSGQQPVDPANDSDDNGSDDPISITTNFIIESNCDPATPPIINHIDFCYFFECGDLNSNAESACADIDDSQIICDISILSTFCNTMPVADPSNPGLPSQLCPDGGVPNNMSWFAFVAYGGTYSVVVTPLPGSCSGSTTGDEGVQIGLYTDCTFSESVYCNPICSLDPVSFDSGLLDEGQTYYFFIDGCAGSVCSYDVEIIGDPQEPDLEPNGVCIDDDGTIDCDDNITLCPDSPISFIADGLTLTVDYTWEISVVPGSGGVYNGDLNPTTETELLPITFDEEGQYEVCLKIIENGCQTWTGDICKIITIEGIDDEVFDMQTVCDIDAFDPSTLMNATAADPTNPNGDPTIGWEDAAYVFAEGTNTNMVEIDGCMYTQTFELSEYTPSPDAQFKVVICDDQLDLSIPGLPVITDASFLGTTEITLEDLLLIGETDKNGCDSIVDYTIERLTIFDGEFMDPICDIDGIIMQFQYDAFLSTDQSFMSFQWLDPAGNPLNDDWNPADPLDNKAPTSIGSGEYILQITIDKEGTSCVLDFPYTVDFEALFPPQPNISGSVSICASGGPQMYTASDVGPNVFQYVWTVTNGTVLNGGGLSDDMIEIDWSTSTGGEITLETINGCGPNSNMISVSIVPQFTPTFTATDTVCVDSPATIVYTGDQSTIDAGGYTWNFNGGSVTNGADLAGPGPFEVTWPTGGTDQTVTLSVTHGGGCVSTTEMAMIHILSPPSPPTINCNPSLNEVTFTWDDVPGADGYMVDVTTGPTGTMNGNSYTITGLAENQTVNITLTIFTGDACVEISANAVCTTQNCTPPVVSIASPLTDPICLNGTDQSFDLVQTIPSGITGSAEFSGDGITDTALGTFDPAVAGVGVHAISYLFTDSDGCFANASTSIEVFATPQASFTTDVDTVCITDPFTITYDGTSGTITEYTTSDGQSITGSINPTITFTQAGNQTITLVVSADGCPSEPFDKEVFVQEELDDVTITCLTQEIDNVEFGWNAVPGATGYEVTITYPDGSMDPPFTTTSTSHPVTGLDPDDQVTITVQVLTNSRCPGDSTSDFCTAKACPTNITVTIDEIEDVCLVGSIIPTDLEAMISGDSDGSAGMLVWSGDGVTGSQFDPSTLSEGTATITVEYIENGCGGYTGSQDVEITLPPLASFDVATDPICVGSSLTIMYTGSDLPSQTIDWSGSGVTVSPTTNANEYIATFDAVGDFDIVLAVTNDGCPPSDVAQTITVEEELIFGEIMCDEGEDQIDFSWNAVDCASGYEVFIGGVSQGVQSQTTYPVTDLGSEETVMIEVIAISECACGDVTSAPQSCTTRACVSIDLSISAMGGVTDFCMSPDLNQIEVITLVEGETGDGAGSFSGTAVDQNGMFDPIAAGVGTHVVTYTYIEPNGCMDFVDEITFNIFDNPVVEAMADPIDCYSDSMTTLTITPTSGDGNYTVTANGSAIDLVSEVMENSYDILVVDGNGCSDATSVVVNVPAEPMPTIDGSEELILGETSNYGIQQSIFSGLSIDSIVWTANGVEVCNDPGCFSLSNQAPTENTTYVATVFYNDGCLVTAMFDVEVREEDPIYTVDIPNIISPNDDGENDLWQVFTGDPNVEVSAARILDRWGNLVFQAPAGSYTPATTVVTWDGKFEDKDLQPGVYVYMVEYTQDGRTRTRTGDITIIR